MSRYLRRGYQLCFALLVMLSLSAVMTSPVLAATSTGKNSSNQRTVIHGHDVPALAGLTPQKLTTNFGVLQLSIALNPRNSQGLNALIAAQKDPTSPQYHHFLTPAQYTSLFGPTPATIDAVVTYLRQQGLTVENVLPNHMMITVSGSMDSVAKAFAVQFAQYAFHGRSVYAPTTDPSVPNELGSTIQSITGLSNVAVPHTMQQTQTAGTPNIGSGPAGGYTPSELRTAYDNNDLYTFFNGGGQNIAVYEQSNYDVNDLIHFRLHYGLGMPAITNTFVNVTSSAETPSGAIEDDLDLDTISAVAPGAHLHVYMGPTDPAGSMQNFIAIWQQIINDDTDKIISTSWGDCEAHFSSADLTALDSLFKQAAAQGQTIFAASGDEGPYDCMFGDTSLSVDYPASDPYVTGVGGTTLSTYAGSGGVYAGESAWSCAGCYTPGRPDGLATGGGYSHVFGRPSYQNGPGVDGTGPRQVPDVAADADPVTGYSMYCTSPSGGCPSGGWMYEGGTSGAAPLWAGFAAEMDAYFSNQNIPTIVDNTLLYSLFNSPGYQAFHDITSGNNLYYPATPGYDKTTGIGTPDVWNLARAAASQAYTRFTSSERSQNPLSMAVHNGTVYVAWTGAGNNLINLMRSTDGGKTFDSSTTFTSVERSTRPVSLAVYNNTLYIAWTGVGNNWINLMHSTDGGNTFDSSTKFVSTQTSAAPVSMVAYNNTLYVTWSDISNQHINLMHSTDGGKTFDNSTRSTSVETTPNPPTMTVVGTSLYVSWTGTYNNWINLMHSTDGGNTFDSSTKFISTETSPIAVSLAALNNTLYIAWTGTGNGYLNVMHSTDGNNTFDSGTKLLLLSETSPTPVTLTTYGNTLYIGWVGTGNNFINVLARTL